MELKNALAKLGDFIARVNQQSDAKPEQSNPLPVIVEKLVGWTTPISRNDLGGVMLDGNESSEYRGHIEDLFLAVAAKTEHISRGTIESAIQLAILKALDIPKSNAEPDFEKRLSISLDELKTTLLKRSEQYLVHMEVCGLAPDGLPHRVGDIEFYLGGGSNDAGQRPNKSVSPTDTSGAEPKPQPQDQPGKHFTHLTKPIEGHVYAIVPIEAVDPEAARVLAEKKLRLTLDTLNFFGDFFGVMESRVTLPGDAGVPTATTFIYSHTSPNPQHVLLGYTRPFVCFSFSQIDVPKAKKSGFERVNSMLANRLPSPLDERILSSLQWAGRASIETRREEAFLLFCISLEALLLSKHSKAEVTQTFALRGAHLLVKDAVHRKEAYRDLKSIYGIRSSIVHYGHTQITEADLSKIRWLTKTALVIMLIAEPFSKMATEEELENWFQDQLLAGVVSVENQSNLDASL
jgi:hypothetical protein